MDKVLLVRIESVENDACSLPVAALCIIKSHMASKITPHGQSSLIRSRLIPQLGSGIQYTDTMNTSKKLVICGAFCWQPMFGTKPTDTLLDSGGCYDKGKRLTDVIK